MLLALGDDREEVERLADAAGPAAVPAFVALGVGLTCAFFPFPVLAAASGVLFGTGAGTAVSILTGTLGALAAFGIARRTGAVPLLTLAGPRLRALLAAVARRGFVAVLYLRIVPGVPRDLANYLAGLTPVRTRDYAGATLLGISPRAFAYTALGGTWGDFTSPEAIVAVALLVAMGALGLWLVRRDLAAGRLRPPGSGAGSSSPGGPTAGRP